VTSHRLREEVDDEVPESSKGTDFDVHPRGGWGPSCSRIWFLGARLRDPGERATEQSPLGKRRTSLRLAQSNQRIHK
jgi:hypothetical protein